MRRRPIRRCVGGLLLAFGLLGATACGASGGKQIAATTRPTTSRSGSGPSGTAPGASGTVPVTQWTDGFCTSFAAWLTAVKAENAKVKAATPTTLAERKALLRALFSGSTRATDQLIGAIRQLQVPDMQHGTGIGPDLLAKFTEFRREISTTGDTVDAASNADPTQFKATASRAISAFQQNVQAIGTSFGQLDRKYPDPKFQRALRTSCAPVLSGG
ncbi:MAG: hypothetical protein JWM05_2010 [Acidimicrobiales bacterium]|nr:hypothetical protein [Acidimicrobiales bacterium]